MPGRIGQAHGLRPPGSAGRAAAPLVPEPHDAALAGRGQQRAVLGEHVDEAVAEAPLDGVDPDVEQHPLGGHEVHDPQRVVEAVAAAEDAERLARRPSARSRRARRARWRRRRRARRGCAPTPAPGRRRGVPSSSSQPAALDEALVEPLVDRAVDRAVRAAAAGSPRAAAASGIVLPLPGLLERTVPEGGVDGEDLPVADVADGPGLGDLVALDGDGDVDVEDLAGRGVRQVLRRGPHALAAARALQRRDGGAEAAPAEQEAAPRDQPRADLQRPAVAGCGSGAGRGRRGSPSGCDSTATRPVGQHLG